MNECGQAQEHIGKRLNVRVTTPQTGRLWKSHFFTDSHQKITFTNMNLIECFWVSPRNAKSLKIELKFNWDKPNVTKTQRIN